MKTLPLTLRSALVVLVPFAVLALLLLWQVDWGRGFARVPPPDDSSKSPMALTVSLLPDYQPADVAGSRDVTDRTLFNPTRRPAPVAIAEAARPRIQPGQFTLTGTLVVDGKAVAFLRELQGGKQRRVAQGELINGMVVSDIRPDRVKLSLGGESEELTLKVATGPKTTIQPVALTPPGGPISASATPAPAGAGPITGARDVSEILAERRRAARAAEAASANQPPGAPQPGAVPAGQTGVPTAQGMVPAPAGNLSTDPQWQEVYRRYQQQAR